MASFSRTLHSRAAAIASILINPPLSLRPSSTIDDPASTSDVDSYSSSEADAIEIDLNDFSSLIQIGVSPDNLSRVLNHLSLPFSLPLSILTTIARNLSLDHDNNDVLTVYEFRRVCKPWALAGNSALLSFRAPSYMTDDDVKVYLNKFPNLASVNLYNVIGVSRGTLELILARYATTLRQLTVNQSVAVTDDIITRLSSLPCTPHLLSLSLRNCYNISDMSLLPLLTTLSPTILSLNLNFTQVSDQSLKALVVSSMAFVPSLPPPSFTGVPPIQTPSITSSKPSRFVEVEEDPLVYAVRNSQSNSQSTSSVTHPLSQRSRGRSSSGATTRSPLLSLSLEMCKGVIGDSFPALFKAASTLSILNLNGCTNIQSRYIQDSACYLHTLSSLNLANCALIDDGAVSAIARVALTLEWVSIAGCSHITNHAAADIGHHLSSLSAINISQTKITSEGVGQIVSGNHHLRSLIMKDCSIDDVALEAIAMNCAVIEEVLIDGCVGVSDHGVCCLVQRAQRLTTLHVR